MKNITTTKPIKQNQNFTDTMLKMFKDSPILKENKIKSVDNFMEKFMNEIEEKNKKNKFFMELTNNMITKFGVTGDKKTESVDFWLTVLGQTLQIEGVKLFKNVKKTQEKMQKYIEKKQKQVGENKINEITIEANKGNNSDVSIEPKKLPTPTTKDIFKNVKTTLQNKKLQEIYNRNNNKKI